MLRKFALGLLAAGSLTIAALAPTSASAHGWHHGWHHGFGYGFAPIVIGANTYDSCYQPRRVMTKHGLRWRTVNVCY